MTKHEGAVGDAVGQAHNLTVLCPVLPHHLDALRRHLESLPAGASSPLSRVPGTHFARWVVIDHFAAVYEATGENAANAPYLVFTSHFDGHLEPYLHSLRAGLGPEADLVWGHCIGYPGAADEEAFVAYLLHNRLPTTFFVAAYPEATVEDVELSLDLRRRFIDWAIAVQDMDPEERLRSFRSAFPARMVSR